MHRSLRVLIAPLGLLLFAGGVGYWIGGRSDNSGQSNVLPMRQIEPMVSGRGTYLTVVPQSETITDGLEEVNRETDRSGREAAIRRLSEALLQMPKASAVREILAFLESGRDAKTGAAFKIGTKGGLQTAPSVRVMLMDLLGRLDPQMAAKQAAQLLQTPTTADEWAVGLRNFAWGTEPGAARDVLRSKALELIQHPGWKAQPTAGYFEAFDVLVYAGATDATPALAQLTLDRARSDLGYAAFLTLDRLVMGEPAAMLAALSEVSDVSSQRPEMLAGFFARADVRDAAQRESLEAYLSSDARSEKEWTAFASIFPNANALVSENLLTSAPRATPGVLADRDRDALIWTESLLKDARFADHVVDLLRLQKRLSQFVSVREP